MTELNPYCAYCEQDVPVVIHYCKDVNTGEIVYYRLHCASCNRANCLHEAPTLDKAIEDWNEMNTHPWKMKQ